MTTYDDVDWHEDALPDGAGPQAAATHVGVFLAWAVLHDLASDALLDGAAAEVAALRERGTTGARLVLARGGRLDGDDLTAVGDAFARAYYAGDDPDDTGDETDDGAGGLYLEDWVDAVVPTGDDPADVYRVPDTWETYDLVAPLVDARFAQWEDEGRPAVLRQRTGS